MESTQYSNEIKWLAYGPILQARHFEAYNINRYKFRTMTKEERMKIQNSRVYVSSNTRSYASMLNIIELNYSCRFTACCSSIFGRIQLPVEVSNKTISILLVLTSLVRYTPVIEKTMNCTYWHQRLISYTIWMMN
ncbi:hypothetical protein AHAS_Ahas17G0292200 [Arachis hypogaea]